MKGYICPVCIFRLLYTVPHFERCQLCHTKTDKRLCSGCSLFTESCRNCNLTIRRGKDYSEALEDELNNLREKYDDKTYFTLERNIQVWKKIIYNFDVDQMLLFCREK